MIKVVMIFEFIELCSYDLRRIIFKPIFTINIARITIVFNEQQPDPPHHCEPPAYFCSLRRDRFDYQSFRAPRSDFFAQTDLNYNRHLGTRKAARLCCVNIWDQCDGFFVNVTVAP